MGINGQALRELYEANGADAFQRGMLEKIRQDQKFRDALIRDFSIRELAEATGYVWKRDKITRLAMNPGLMLHEAVDWTTFTVITQEVLSGMYIRGFDEVPGISGNLCEEVPSGGMDTVTIPAYFQTGSLKQRLPGQDYEEATLGVKYVRVSMLEPAQNASDCGRLMTLKEEDIFFDRTGTIKSAAQGFGRAVRQQEETEFFNRVSDATGYKTWYPLGTQATLYTTGTTADTTGVTARCNKTAANALADYTDVQIADAQLALMTDERGMRIHIIGKELVCPRALEQTAHLAQIQLTGVGKGGVDQVSTTIIAGLGMANNRTFNAYSTPYLDANAVGTWYWGDFRAQFVRIVVWPGEVMAESIPPTAEWYIKNNVVFVTRGRWWKRTTARDYRYVIQCPAS